jgi:hypothetical protein
MRSFHEYKGIEVSGGTLQATLQAFGPFKTLASKLLLAEGVGRKAADGLITLELQSWYPLDAYLRAFERAAEQLGDAMLHQIGVSVMTNVQWPPAMKDFRSLAQFLDMGYHLHHRRNGLVMADPASGRISEGIGHYVGRMRGNGTAEFEIDVPYPCAFDKGILFGALRRLQIVGAITHDETHPCRKRGDPSCLYVVKG